MALKISVGKCKSVLQVWKSEIVSDAVYPLAAAAPSLFEMHSAGFGIMTLSGGGSSYKAGQYLVPTPGMFLRATV